MKRIRRLLKQLSPIKEMADEAFAKQEAQHRIDKQRADERRKELLSESEEQRRRLLERP
jgi:hypothetical protein